MGSPRILSQTEIGVLSRNFGPTCVNCWALHKDSPRHTNQKRMVKPNESTKLSTPTFGYFATSSKITGTNFCRWQNTLTIIRLQSQPDSLLSTPIMGITPEPIGQWTRNQKIRHPLFTFIICLPSMTYAVKIWKRLERSWASITIAGDWNPRIIKLETW